MKYSFFRNTKLLRSLTICLLFLLLNSCKHDKGIKPLPKLHLTSIDEAIILEGKRYNFGGNDSYYRNTFGPVYSKELIYMISSKDSLINGVGLHILHSGDREVGVYNIDINLRGSKKVAIDVFSPSGNGRISLDAGNYTLEKLNGKWVSIVKNGSGINSAFPDKRYSNIEFRIIWSD